jgi:hypothetical protein
MTYQLSELQVTRDAGSLRECRGTVLRGEACGYDD